MSVNAFPKPVTTGLPVYLTPLRPTVAIGAIDIENLLYLVNDPAEIEQEAARTRKSGHAQSEYSRLREMVQRMVGTAASPKAKNVGNYADYIAAGLSGALGNAWSIPPITLWSRRPLEITPETGQAYFPIRDGLIAIDGETQITALHRIRKNLTAFGLETIDFDSTRIAFEIYHGISALEARQIFHDRNNKGALVDKSLAMSMDMRDFGTTITQQLVDSTIVTIDDRQAPLSDFILTGKRQVAASAKEWLTLQGLRTLVVTTLLGTNGIHAASADVDPSDLAGQPDAASVKREIVELLSDFLRTNAALFHHKTAITAPAVLAAVGAVLHRQTTWTTDPLPATLTAADLLRDVKWQRDAAHWAGIAAKVTDRGTISFAGGARDSGHRTYEALNNPASPIGRQVRGAS
ncbi:DNA sulfur modification protein DndB [Nocardia huaxiensis]|uniref:DNA sulfur modification protein DndB n=1 Tax=Nocardia huaxiensis TaxID=2755382 RepID=UPI001E36D829|nr:DNA sulfur modification protein DndB [Nocardia huaxiensis]UFS99586.1 DNA sulfur modification protein DndB [Nocardia huaxiensis]